MDVNSGADQRSGVPARLTDLFIDAKSRQRASDTPRKEKWNEAANEIKEELLSPGLIHS